MSDTRSHGFGVEISRRPSSTELSQQAFSSSPFEQLPGSWDGGLGSRLELEAQNSLSSQAGDAPHASPKFPVLQAVASLDSEAPLLPDEQAENPPEQVPQRTYVPKSALKSFSKVHQCRKRSSQPQQHHHHPGVDRSLKGRAVSWRADLVQVREYEASERSEGDGRWKKLGCCALQ